MPIVFDGSARCRKNTCRSRFPTMRADGHQDPAVGALRAKQFDVQLVGLHHDLAWDVRDDS